MKPMTKAIKLAKKIPSGAKTKVKCIAVHRWVLAVKDMLDKGAV